MSNNYVTRQSYFAIKIIVEKIAEKKAGSNCMGFLYEPNKPKKLIDHNNF